MLLFCLLCVILVFGGLAFRRELAAWLADVRLSVFGVRALCAVRRKQRNVHRPGAPPPSVPPRPWS